MIKVEEIFPTEIFSKKETGRLNNISVIQHYTTPFSELQRNVLIGSEPLGIWKI